MQRQESFLWWSKQTGPYLVWTPPGAVNTKLVTTVVNTLDTVNPKTIDALLGKIKGGNFGARQIDDVVNKMVAVLATENVEKAEMMYLVSCTLSTGYPAFVTKLTDCVFAKPEANAIPTFCLVVSNLWLSGCVPNTEFIKITGKVHALATRHHAVVLKGVLNILNVCGPELVGCPRTEPVTPKYFTDHLSPSILNDVVAVEFSTTFKALAEGLRGQANAFRSIHDIWGCLRSNACPDLALPAWMGGGSESVEAVRKEEGKPSIIKRALAVDPNGLPIGYDPTKPKMSETVDYVKRRLKRGKPPVLIPAEVKVYVAECITTKCILKGINQYVVELCGACCIIRNPHLYVCGKFESFEEVHATVQLASVSSSLTQGYEWLKYESGQHLIDHNLQELLMDWHNTFGNESPVNKVVREGKLRLLRNSGGLVGKPKSAMTLSSLCAHRITVAPSPELKATIEKFEKDLSLVIYSSSATDYYIVGPKGKFEQLLFEMPPGAEDTSDAESFKAGTKISSTTMEEHLMTWFKRYSSTYHEESAKEIEQQQAATGTSVRVPATMETQTVLDIVNKLRSIAQDNMNRRATLDAMDKVMESARSELFQHRNDGRWSELLVNLEQISMEYELEKYHIHGTPLRVHSSLSDVFVLKIDDNAAPFTERRPSLIKGDSVLLCVKDPHPIAYQASILSISPFQLLFHFHRKVHQNPAALVKQVTNHIHHKLLFDILYHFDPESFRRMRLIIREPKSSQFLERFPYRRDQVTYSGVLPDIPADKKRNMNPSQENAVEAILRLPPLFAVWGPPGTGKTSTLVEAVRRVLMQETIRTKKSGSLRVLITTPSNASADHFACSLLEAGIPVGNHLFRLYSPSFHPTLAPPQLLAYTSPTFSRAPTEMDVFTFPQRGQKITANIVVSTLTTSFMLRELNVDPFDVVIIDEAGQAYEPECLIPVVACTKSEKSTVVLAGDHKQLNPVVTCVLSRKFCLDLSLLERKIDEIPHVMLNICYRCHEKILEMFNGPFYDGRLQHCSLPHMHSAGNWSLLKVNPTPVRFFHVVGEQQQLGTTSFCNASEADVVYKLIQTLVEEKIVSHPRNIGVVTPYRLQFSNIRQGLQMRNYLMPGVKEVLVGSVETFQGQERDVMIISTVRSSSKDIEIDQRQGIGFLGCPKRINVALSRAKALLILVGDANLLSAHDGNWKTIINHCKAERTFFDWSNRKTEGLDKMMHITRPSVVPLYLQEWPEERIQAEVKAGRCMIGTIQITPIGDFIVNSTTKLPLSTMTGEFKVINGTEVAAWIYTPPNEGIAGVASAERRVPSEHDDGEPIFCPYKEEVNTANSARTKTTAVIVKVLKHPKNVRIQCKPKPDNFKMLTSLDPTFPQKSIMPTNLDVLLSTHPDPPSSLVAIVELHPDNWETFLMGTIVEFSTVEKASATDIGVELPQYQVPTAMMEPAEDMTDALCFTIDDADTIVLDDALSLRVLPGRDFEVGVHIADVCRVLEPGTPEDKDAYVKGCTVYGGTNATVHMLPEELRTQGSLNPTEERFAVSFLWKVDEHGVIQSEEIKRTKIRSARRFTYQEVDSFIQKDSSDDADLLPDGTKDGDEEEQKKYMYSRAFNILHRIATQFRHRRIGGPENDYFNPKINVDIKGGRLVQQETGSSPSQNIVGEFMITANARAARKIMTWMPQHAVLVRQDSCRPSALLELANRVNDSTSVPITVASDTYTRLLQSISSSRNKLSQPLMLALWNLSTRLQGAAQICLGCEWPASLRHSDLQVPYYTYFTSPLRRYVDVIVHRQLLTALKLEEASVDTPPPGFRIENLTTICERLSATMKKAKQVSREAFSTELGQYIRAQRGITATGIIVEMAQRDIEVMFPLLDGMTKRLSVARLKDWNKKIASITWEAEYHVVEWIDEMKHKLELFGEWEFELTISAKEEIEFKLKQKKIN